MGYEARIYEAITGIRKDLAARERETFGELARAHQKVIGRLVPEIERLQVELDGLIAAGKPINIGRIYRLDRYKSLLLQSEQLFAQYGDEIGRTLGPATRRAIGQATRDASELTKAALGPAPQGVTAEALFTKLPDTAVEHVVGMTREGPLAELLGQYGAFGKQQAQDALVSGVALGEHPWQIAKRLKDAAGIALTRANAIARTEVLRTYRETQRRWYQENSRVVKGLVWHSALGVHTCAACWAMHGQEFPLDAGPMGTHPNCRCAMVPKTKTWKELGFDVDDSLDRSANITPGSELFGKLSPAQQRRILGPRAHKAYLAGEVDLDDFVHVSISKDWGVTRRRSSLRSARERAEKRGILQPTPRPTTAPIPTPAPKPKVTPADKLKPGQFADMKEARQWAEAKYPHIEWDIDELDLDVMNPTLARFDELAGKYPRVAEELRHVGARSASSKYPYSWGSNTYAHATTDRKVIGLNKRWYGDAKKFKFQLDQDVASNWHPAGTDKLDSIFIHEWGHQVHNWLLRAPGDRAFLPGVGASGGGSVRDTFARYFYNQRGTSKLSRYSLKKGAKSEETFAESFVAQYYSPAEIKKLAPVHRQKIILDLLADDSKWLGPGEWKYIRDIPLDERAEHTEKIDKLFKELGI